MIDNTMNKEFDFSQVGKRMPYSVPDDFFGELEENVMRQASAIAAEPKPSPWRKRIAWGSCISAAAAVALLLTVNVNSTKAADGGGLGRAERQGVRAHRRRSAWKK